MHSPAPRRQIQRGDRPKISRAGAGATRLPRGLIALLGLLLVMAVPSPCLALEVVAVRPADDALGVSLEPVIQIHFNDRFDHATITPATIRLVRAGEPPVDGGRDAQPDGDPPIEYLLGGDLGGVVTLTVTSPLAPATDYAIEVGEGLRSATGTPVVPFRSRFTTTDQPAAAPDEATVEALRVFRFDAEMRLPMDGLTGVAMAGNTAYACCWGGKVIQVDLDDAEDQGGAIVLIDDPARRFISVRIDPRPGEATALWLTWDHHPRQSVAPNDWSGGLSRLTLRPDGGWHEETWITGFPTGDHPLSSPVTGPCGKLFLSMGALTMLGAPKPGGLEETPLSAAVLVVDLDHPDLAPAVRPLDVRTAPAGDYDPDVADAPLRVFATGVRQAYAIAWHRNGQAYAGVNMNDTGDPVPVRDGIGGFSARPPEMMIRIVEGAHYGHPNPSRDQWILLGGNSGHPARPWQIDGYPAGTEPDPGFDPELLIYDLESIDGPSANGAVEYRTPGPLDGRLILAFYTATRGLHSFLLDEDGRSVLEHQPLLDPDGRQLRLASPLDLAHDPASGRLLVADFTAPERGDTGRDGGLWILRPVGFSVVRNP